VGLVALTTADSYTPLRISLPTKQLGASHSNSGVESSSPEQLAMIAPCRTPVDRLPDALRTWARIECRSKRSRKATSPNMQALLFSSIGDMFVNTLMIPPGVPETASSSWRG